MKRKTKAMVQTHADWYEEPLPAINVKVHQSLYPLVLRVASEFRCSEEIAERAVQWAFESECETFWAYWSSAYPYNDNPDNGVGYYFPDHQVTVESQGRSGGWLVVKGLPPVSEWDAILVARWWKFVKSVEGDIAYRISDETLMNEIAANDWAGTQLLAELTEVA